MEISKETPASLTDIQHSNLEEIRTLLEKADKQSLISLFRGEGSGKKILNISGTVNFLKKFECIFNFA